MAKKQKKNFKRKSDFDNRPKYCKFTSLGIEEVDFKDIKLLKEYITETGKRSDILSNIREHNVQVPLYIERHTLSCTPKQRLRRYLCASVGVRVFIIIEFAFSRFFSSDFFLV